MPAVRSVTIENNLFRITDKNSTKTLDATTIAAAQNTVAKQENWINNTWIPANITDYQCRVHVYSIKPLVCTVGTWDLGVDIPDNWWVDI